jgi:hypothetical protein
MLCKSDQGNVIVQQAVENKGMFIPSHCQRETAVEDDNTLQKIKQSVFHPFPRYLWSSCRENLEILMGT